MLGFTTFFLAFKLRLFFEKGILFENVLPTVRTTQYLSMYVCYLLLCWELGDRFTHRFGHVLHVRWIKTADVNSTRFKQVNMVFLDQILALLAR